MRIRYVLSGIAALAALGGCASVAPAASAPSSPTPSASAPTSVNQLLISAAQTESDADMQYQTYA
ncbi:MAG: hypothetical protein QOG96_6983, partial [Pseudonocardiales bacterium]|nr:hypothetical protein [Pseudonocardiales bacterium]